MSDGMHKMGFAKSDPSVDVERVLSFRRHVNHGERRSVRKLIARADNESVEGVLGIEGQFYGFGLQSPNYARAEPRVGNRKGF